MKACRRQMKGGFCLPSFAISYRPTCICICLPASKGVLPELSDSSAPSPVAGAGGIHQPQVPSKLGRTRNMDGKTWEFICFLSNQGRRVIVAEMGVGVSEVPSHTVDD